LRKILVILGSHRKGNTFQACEELHGHIEKDMPVEFEYLWLKDSNLLPCKGCFGCICNGEGTCPNHDDAPAIERKMLEADCVIFALPVFVMNVSGLMKNFMDRFGYFGHRPRFFDKKAILLVTTGGGGLNSVMKYMNMIVSVWGFEVVGKAGLIAPPDLKTQNPSRLKNAGIILSRAAGALSKSFKSGRRKSPGPMSTVIFSAQRVALPMLETVFPFDCQYWEGKGWFAPGMKYFVDVPVNPVFAAVGKMFGLAQKRAYKRELKGIGGGE
jgi:multimeric flavodoxin WrbA